MPNQVDNAIDQLKLNFSAFRDELHKLLDDDRMRTWVEETYETYEHGRAHELGVWWKDENGQRFGYVFLAKVGWRGVQPGEWGKIHQIIHTHDWAIGPFEDVRVWNLNSIISQDKPLPRCTRCGQFIKNRDDIIDEVHKAVQDWITYNNETIGRMPNAARENPGFAILNLIGNMK